MKRITLFLVAICALTQVSCIAQNQIQGSNTATKLSKFNGERITGMSVGGGWDVTIRQGNTTGVEITIPDNLTNHYQYSLKEGIFTISSTEKHRGVHLNKVKLEAVITCSSLERISLSGGVDLSLQGIFTGNTVNISTSGGSDIDFADGSVLNCTSAELSHSGGADGDLHINALESVSLSVSGGADINLAATSKSSSISVSGGADLDLSGRSDLIEYSVSGGADIDGKDYVGTDVRINASGSADIKVHATKSLSIRKSGGASISYKGNPSVTQEGDSSIKRLD